MYFLYSRAIKGGGAVIKSTSSGGGSTQTSSNGGGFSVTSANGGSQTITSSNYIEAHIMSGVPENSIGTENYGNHLHEVVVPGHSHTVTVSNHTHTVTVSDHSHSVPIPSHTHSIDLPEHTHDIDYGIYMLNRLPTAVTIKVDGNTVPFTDLSAENLDLIPYLSKEVEDKVTRGWHTVEITPNDLGRINAQVTTQFFIQSRGGGNY